MAAVSAIIAAGATIGGSIYKKHKAKQALNAANNEHNILKDQEKYARENRQDIINPYEDVKDLSGMVTNPFAQMGVATEAAKFQAEEADISLANTLDLMRETGAAAGGATALAQAALRSKKGISASIETQEANVNQMRAQGEAQANRERVAEKQRVQEAGVMGDLFQFQAQEARDIADLERVSAKADRAYDREAQAELANTEATSGMITSLGSAFGGMNLGGFGGGPGGKTGYLNPGEWAENRAKFAPNMLNQNTRPLYDPYTGQPIN